jgi:type II secretory pathway predicted ATPase ExeA
LNNASSNIHASCILDPHLNFNEILHCTLDVFGLSEPASDGLTITQRLNRYLVEQLRNGHLAALMLDEAQALDDQVLEELIVLSDLEDAGKKLLQIVLLGQPELESRLDQTWLRPLKKRVTIRSRLAPLSGDDIKAYIEFRLSQAGYRGNTIFVPQAIEEIRFYSKGIPRLVNIICDNALLISCAKSRKIVDRGTIEEVADELQLGGSYSAESQSTSANLPSVETHEERGPYTVGRGNRDTQADDRWVVNFEQGAQSSNAPLPANNRVEIKWAALGVAAVIVMVLLAGEMLLSPPQEPQSYFSPVADNVQKVTKFLAPIPGRLYRAVTVNTERLHDPGPFAQAWKDSSKETENARGSNLKEPQQKRRDVTRATASRAVQQPARRHQSVENKKPVVSRKEFKVVGNSLVRDKPSSSAAIITTLHPGMEIQLLRRTGDYLQIRSMEKATVRGYVHIEDAFFEPLNSRLSRVY